MKRLGLAVVLVALAACAKNSNPAVATPPPGSAAPSAVPRTGQSIVLTSSSFAANANIPMKYSCQGAGTSPQLSWKNVPTDAKELALVVFDPDAPNGGFLHWVVFKIPVTATSFPEGSIPAGARQATNGTGKATYQSMCPPTPGKVHHYQFTLTALSAPIDLPNGAQGSAVRGEIANKKIADGVLVGLYERH
jgi:Raf kinase inhibitor-like YbhB/YbcL family protein